MQLRFPFCTNITLETYLSSHICKFPELEPGRRLNTYYNVTAYLGLSFTQAQFTTSLTLKKNCCLGSHTCHIFLTSILLGVVVVHCLNAHVILQNIFFPIFNIFDF